MNVGGAWRTGPWTVGGSRGKGTWTKGRTAGYDEAIAEIERRFQGVLSAGGG